MFILFLFSITSPSLAQPSPDLTLSSFTQLQKHIRSWTPAPDDEPFTPAIGACLTLKLRGEVIARSTAWSEHPFDEKPESPTVLRRVLAQALKQAEPKLGVSNDAFRDDAIKQVAQEITLSLELAGPLTTIEPNTWDDAEMQLRPGLDGVATQRASRVSERNPSSRSEPGLASIFPAQMLLTTTLPHRALASTIAQTLGEGGAAAALEEPKKIREKNNLRFYRFRTSHAALPAPRATPCLLYRGQRLIPGAQPTSTAELRQLAEELATHLTRLVGHTSPQSAASIFAVQTGEVRRPPVELGPMDQLLAAAALTAHCEHTPGLLADSPYAEAYCGYLTDFLYVALKSAQAEEPIVPAMPVLIRNRQSKGRSMGHFVRVLRPLKEVVWGIEFDRGAAQELELKNRKLIDLAALPPAGKGLVIYAGMKLGPSGPESLAFSENVLAQAFVHVGDGKLVSAMPWLGWAEIEHGSCVSEEKGDLNHLAELPRALALRHMRDQVWQHQLTPLTATEDTQDMIGGIVFTKGLGEAGGSGGGNPYPTWQCVRPLAFIATMLGDPRLTSAEERPREIANLLLAMRYLRQLQVDDASAWMYPNPDQARGGIRAAVWDPSEPIDATSLTLLTVTELLKSLDKLAAERVPTPQPAPAPTK